MGKPSKILQTWGKGARFSYTGSVKEGTTIYYGEDLEREIEVSRQEYSRLLAKFSGHEVPIGTTRTNLPKGSVGEWWSDNIGGPAAMSYVGAILEAEGYATKPRRGIIRFRSSSN